MASNKIPIYGEFKSETADGILAEAKAIRSYKGSGKTVADDLQTTDTKADNAQRVAGEAEIRAEEARALAKQAYELAQRGGSIPIIDLRGK